MSPLVLFIALLHALFVLYVARRTLSRVWTTVAFIAALVVAFSLGTSGYGPLDAVAAVIGFVLAWSLLVPKQKASKPEPAPELPKMGALRVAPLAFSISVPLLLLAGGIGVFAALLLGGLTGQPATMAVPARLAPAAKVQTAPTPLAGSTPVASPSRTDTARKSGKSPELASSSRVGRQPVKSTPPAVPQPSLQVVPPQEKPAPSSHPATLPMGIDHGNHSGFPPECRWVTPIQWSCRN